MRKFHNQDSNGFALRLTTGLLGAVACLVARPASADEASPKVQMAPAPAQGGMVVHVDPQTGRVLPGPAPGTTTLQLSPAEQNRLSTSSQGLVEEPAPGGGYRIHLQGRFQSPLMATTGPDGKVRIQHMGEQAGEVGHDHKH